MLIKYNTQTKSLIINFFFYVLKLPLSTTSFQSLKLEILNYKKIKNLELFNKVLLNNFSFYFMLFLSKGKKIDRSHNKKFLNFYLDIFKDQNLETIIVKNKIELENVKKFIEKYMPVSLYDFEKLIENEIVCSPAHGDLHYKNVILKNNKYYIIDWGLYSKNSCYLFDLINYKIFSSKYYKFNWFEILIKYRRKFYKFIDKRYIDLFIIWKINNELKFINLNAFKTEKYKKNLNYFFSNLY